MKTKLFKNLSFVICVILIVFFVAVFNFLIDPYSVFRKKEYMDFNKIPRDYMHIVLKAYKDVPCDTVIVGSSNTLNLFQNEEFYSYFFNKIAITNLSYKEIYQLLKDYIFLHPETKNVIIPISYFSFSRQEGEPISQLDKKNFNLKELLFLLLSKESTKQSIKKLKNEDLMYSHNQKRIIDDVIGFNYFPNTVLDIKRDNQVIISNIDKENTNIEYLNKIVSLLKEKNIKYKIIIIPPHVINMSMMFSFPEMQKVSDELKRLCVKLSDDDVYDFSIINKYTTSGFPNNNYLYGDLAHPNFIIGLKIFKVLRGDLSYKDLYVKINKNNIEQHIKNQHKLTKEYIKNNKSLIDYYINYYDKNTKGDPFYYVVVKDFNNAPNYVTDEIKWYRQKLKNINAIYRQGKELKKGVWNNKI